MAEKESYIEVEVAYALPEKQVLLTVQVKADSTVRTALLASGILQQFPELDLDTLKVGIFSKKTKMSQTLREQDRIEIYRPLIADPKKVRKERAAAGKRMRKGGGKE